MTTKKRTRTIFKRERTGRVLPVLFICLKGRGFGNTPRKDGEVKSLEKNQS